MKLNFEYQGFENMVVCRSIGACTKSVACLSSNIETQMGSKLCSVVSRRPYSSYCFRLHPRNPKTKYTHLSVSKNHPSNMSPTFHKSFVSSCFSKERGKLWSLTVKDSVSAPGLQRRHLKISLANTSMCMRLLVPKQRISWPPGCATAGLIGGLLVFHSSSKPVQAEAAQSDDDSEDECDSSYAKLSHGKKVFTDYSIIGIPGDGRCLFRSVAHGACLRWGKPAPSESHQRELADDLRARVADEFIKRREETEWFVEGDFDTYVAQIRKPHIWGGEPELFMASHVLRMPITVYMHDRDAGGLISIAEYGQEYGKENPIRVLYYGFGHYDALQIPGKKGAKPRL